LATDDEGIAVAVASRNTRPLARKAAE
jgi:hypothetical protein